jgi:hypothetical protein
MSTDLTIYQHVTLKNIWELCFGANPHTVYAIGLYLYRFGVLED